MYGQVACYSSPVDFEASQICYDVIIIRVVYEYCCVFVGKGVLFLLVKRLHRNEQ